ncbi:hypothetical protein E2C01_003466 [Portunus trituberculatus]|uniref:Uncharacterized protein n=1 Tax=Portunus trituberculatus TaxID=210409 RepID=A0A5B7CTM1_PORTR|nr:hypothetical protein [Portunus trituberculatus]
MEKCKKKTRMSRKAKILKMKLQNVRDVPSTVRVLTVRLTIHATPLAFGGNQYITQEESRGVGVTALLQHPNTPSYGFIESNNAGNEWDFECHVWHRYYTYVPWIFKISA